MDKNFLLYPGFAIRGKGANCKFALRGTLLQFLRVRDEIKEGIKI